MAVTISNTQISGSSSFLVNAGYFFHEEMMNFFQCLTMAKNKQKTKQNKMQSNQILHKLTRCLSKQVAPMLLDHLEVFSLE